jgi:hypothetical protein
MERPAFTVGVSTDPMTVPTEYLAVISHQDMLRGEQLLANEPGKPGGMLMSTAWCYASLVRLGHYTGSWEEFRDYACHGIEPAADVKVDPTQLPAHNA